MAEKEKAYLTIKTQNGLTVYQPVVLDAPVLDREKNKPSVFTFVAIMDGDYFVEEGDTVTVVSDTLKPDGYTHNVFFGFVFSIAPAKNKTVTVKAYDQLRYFQNTDTYVYENKTLTELLRMICGDCQIKAGPDIMDSGYVIGKRVEDNKAYTDMLLTAIKLTKDNTNVEYILWDNFGEIAMHDQPFFYVPLILDKNAFEDYGYESSIDSDTYNQIKLYREKDDGSREVFIANDQKNIDKWGLLQLTESVSDDENPDAKKAAMLTQYNKKTRSLSVKGAFGDIRFRGGTKVYVQLEVGMYLGLPGSGKYTINGYFFVDKVTHTFKHGRHSMDLVLTGGLLDEKSG